MHIVLQRANFGILTKKCLLALLHTNNNCLKRIREQRAEEWELIYSLLFFKLSLASGKILSLS